MSGDQADDHAEHLNEAVDCGGCAELWEATSDARSRGTVSRRGFLGRTGTIALAVLGTGTAAAGSTIDDHDLYTELDDREALSVLRSLRTTEVFHQISRDLRQDGVWLQSSEAIVARVNGSEADSADVDASAVADVAFDIVNVPVVGTEAVEAHAVLRRDRATGRITLATVEYIEERREGVPTARRVVDYDGGKDDVVVESSLAEVQTASLGIGCTACKAAVPILCQIGCHTSTAFICGVLTGLNIIAGGSCFTFTQVACGVISTLGCGGTRAEEICSHPDLNLC